MVIVKHTKVKIEMLLTNPLIPKRLRERALIIEIFSHDFIDVLENRREKMPNILKVWERKGHQQWTNVKTSKYRGNF